MVRPLKREGHTIVNGITQRVFQFFTDGQVQLRYVNEDLDRAPRYALECLVIPGDPEMLAIVREDGQPQKMALVPSSLLETLGEWLRLPSDVSALQLVVTAAGADWFQIDLSVRGYSVISATRPGSDARKATAS